MLLRTIPMAVAAGVVIGLVPSVAQAPGTDRMPAAERGMVAGQRDGSAAAPGPLHGVRIALDPGHQLGNHNFPDETDRIVNAGAHGFRKACNTTGTAIDGGLPEATVAWRIVGQVRERLRALGAQVVLTRTTNSERQWGPCVDARGRFGARHHARLMVSIHADGVDSTSLRGFHVIRPDRGRLVAPGIVRPSARLARDLRRGLDARDVPRSNYVGGGSGLDARDDLGTLNLSRVPVAMVEIGNVHNPHDARLMSSRLGRDRYARALVTGIREFVGR